MNDFENFKIPFYLRKKFLYEYQEGKGNKYILQEKGENSKNRQNLRKK